MDLFGEEPIIEEDNLEDNTNYLLQDDSENLDILKGPKQSNFLLGHTGVERELLTLWHNNRMPHAIVFNGLKGVGKATFAYRLARFVLVHSNQPCADALFEDQTIPHNLTIPENNPVFSKVASGGHPDLMIVSPPFDEKKGKHKDEIPVDDIRKVAPFLRKTSSNGGWRVVIIDDASTMNRNGQNALLKILEEPPKKALLLLVTHGAGGLLPTIRSRCRIMSFKPIDFDDLEIILNKASDGILSSTDVQMLAMLTEGSAGQAVNLLQENGLDDIKTILEALCRIKSLTHDQIDALALSFGKSGNNHSDRNFTFTIIWWLECLINMSANDIPKLTIGKLNIYIPNDWSLHYLVSLHENIAEHIETCINGSLDKRYMIYKALRIIQG